MKPINMSYTPSWMNAVADDVALRKTYSDRLAEIYKMIAACNNSASGCKGKTGKTINDWRDGRDKYNSLIKSLDAKILSESTTLTAAEKLKTQAAIAAQEEGKAELIAAASSSATTSKYVYIAIGAVVLIVGGIIAYKKLRKGK